ncbi:uncharacterized protein LOC118151625 isoform X1 [Callithrix jacchus]
MAAMLARGAKDGVTEDYGPANNERVPTPGPRPAPPGSPPRPAGTGRSVGAARRTKLHRAPRGPRSLAPLAHPQPAPPQGPARPTVAPHEPYLLAADAAVHKPAVSAVARSRSRRPQPEPEGTSRPPLPHRVRHRLPSSQRSRALRQTKCNRRAGALRQTNSNRRPGAGRRRPTTQARWSGLPLRKADSTEYLVWQQQALSLSPDMVPLACKSTSHVVAG